MLSRFFTAVLFLASLGSPVLAQDASDAIVRLNRIENQVRQMSGQIEQLQFENRSLKEQVRKFQEDVEFRFQESRGGSRAVPAPSPTPGGAAPTRPAQPQRRSDAFEPDSAPEAPGAPRPLGTTTPSAPVASAAPQGGAPMPLPGGALSGIGDLIECDE